MALESDSLIMSLCCLCAEVCVDTETKLWVNECRSRVTARSTASIQTKSELNKTTFHDVVVDIQIWMPDRRMSTGQGQTFVFPKTRRRSCHHRALIRHGSILWIQAAVYREICQPIQMFRGCFGSDLRTVIRIVPKSWQNISQIWRIKHPSLHILKVKRAML